MTIGNYSIIYADPPWQYQRSKVQGAAENHYPTMGIDELCALPVADLAAPDSALFLWATFPQLPEALRLIEAWGFRYKSVAFVWLKKNKKADSWFYGLGFWTRGNAEICLLATKGHPKRQAANIHQFIISPIEAHSKKPDEAREKIVALMGDLPRVELFARQSPPGWEVWGNEVKSTIPDFGTKCPEVRDGALHLVSPHVPAGRGLSRKELHAGQVAQEGNNLVAGLVRLFAVGFNGGNDKLMDIRGLPFGMAPGRQQADFRVAPRPEAQAVKPTVRLFVFLQPDKSHGFISEAPRLNEPQGLRQLRERGPQKKCAVRGRQISHRERT